MPGNPGRTLAHKQTGRSAGSAGRPVHASKDICWSPVNNVTGDLPKRFAVLSRGMTSDLGVGPKLVLLSAQKGVLRHIARLPTL